MGRESLSRVKVSGLNIENQAGQTKAPGQSFSVRWQVFWVTASLGAAFACCASEAGHNTQKPRLAGEVRLASMAAGKNCYTFVVRGFGKTRKFCPPCAVGHLRQFAAQRFGFGAGFGSCGAGWSLSFLEMASGLGGERPSPSAKVVDVKLCRLVEVLGNHERLGKNSRRRWHKDVEGERPFASKLLGNINRPFRPSQSASA